MSMNLPQSIFIDENDLILYSASFVTIRRNENGSVSILTNLAEPNAILLAPGETADRLWKVLTFHAFRINGPRIDESEE